MDRLSKIFNCIPPSHVVADIGCDHGNLEAMLLNEKKADRVIATDISEKSLAKAVALCESLGISHKADFRQGDGLSVLSPGEADTIVIAGVGGNLISEILSEGQEVARQSYLVLCPHTHEGVLRKFLFGSGYHITQECLSLEEGRYYQIICARYDGQRNAETDDFYCEIGRKLLNSGDGLLEGFLRYKIRIARGIIKNAGKSDGTEAKNLVLSLSGFVQRLEDSLKCLHP